MSKRAKEKALERYPQEDRIGIAIAERTGFICGYDEAEKDLALTWEDVAKIITIYEAGIDNGDYRRYNEAEWMKEYSQDILKRFNELKNK